MSAPEAEHRNESHSLTLPDVSGAVPTSAEARAKHRIAVLEDELQYMKQERRGKQRKTTFYVSQGRAIRHMGIHLFLFHAKFNGVNQTGLLAVLLWLHERLMQLNVDDSQDMLKQLKRGANAMHGNNTSTLKDLVAAWINQDFHPPSLLKSDDKHAHGFIHEICGKLLCPSEWDWGDDHVKAGIHNRTSDYIVSENSWPLFLYENYMVKLDNLEQGLFRSKILVQAFKAVFTSPSSTREADRDGDGADILENNRRARQQLNQVKVKTCVASIINMRKVTPCSLAYVVCQVCFALSNVSSWHTVNGDFDYEAFWSNIMDFFENVPGPVTQQRVDQLLEWWTRKVFSKNHCEDLTPAVVSRMSVTSLVEQRKALEDAAFDSE